MKIKTYKTHEEIERKIEFIELDPSIFVFKITTTVNKFDENNNKIETKKFFNQGMVEKSQIDLMLKDKPYKSYKAYACSDEFISCAKKTNFFEAEENFKPKRKNISTRVFDDLKSGRFDLNNLYYLDSDYNFKDWKGNTIPFAIHFYIEENEETHQKINVSKIAKYLLTKERIVFPDTKDKSELKPEDLIQKTIVENFDTDEDEEVKYIIFTWEPSDVEFDLFYQKTKKLHPHALEKEYVNVILQMDLLGFRKNKIILDENNE